MGFQWPQESITSNHSLKALRQTVLEQIAAAKSGHPGGSLSLVEIIAAMFDGNFEHSSARPDDPSRDRLVLSKGHGVPALYSALSFEGFFDASELKNLRSLGHFLQGHPDRSHYDLMEASTGSLGQGASVALGLAMGLKLKFDRKEISRLPKVYCVLGDGEMQEGQVWEMLMSAPKFKLDNLICILDYNKGQIDGPVKEVMDLEPIADKLKSFNWDVHEVDGHSIEEIKASYVKAASGLGKSSKPQFVVAHTLKGKGVSFMEHPTAWHGAAPSMEQLEEAIAELYSDVEGSFDGGSPYGRILEGNV
jgi:transketolase